jgi:ferredoxin/flavodoxin---NADP+ reductase
MDNTSFNAPAGVAAPHDEGEAPKWTGESILSVRAWTPSLFSFRTTRARGFRFAPGQFARIGIATPTGGAVWRAYSIVSAAHDEHLEFFSVVIPDGKFTSRLATFRPGERIMVEKAAYGFLTLDRFAGGTDLWMIASGTGLGPFLSILHDPRTWSRFENLILVHSVRQSEELAYRDEIAALGKHALSSAQHARLSYVPVVTRVRFPDALPERIPQLIEDGRLEKAAGVGLDLERSRLMICGNPQMASDLRSQLTGRGFRAGRRNDPGQLAFENYW